MKMVERPKLDFEPIMTATVQFMNNVIIRGPGRFLTALRGGLSNLRAKLRLRSRVKHAWGFSQASLTFFFVVVIWDILTSIWDTGTISHPPVSSQSALTILTFVGLVAGLFFIVSRSSERLWKRIAEALWVDHLFEWPEQSTKFISEKPDAQG